MIQAWLIPEEIQDQFAPNSDEFSQFFTVEDLEQQTSVTAIQVCVDKERQVDILREIPAAQKYSYHDVIEISRMSMGVEFEKKLKMFFAEHLHKDDEVRFILDGTGYFDVRDKNDRWIRIAVKKGDFLTLPAGIYHRFTVDQNEFLKAMRLFVGAPVWTAFNRGKEADNFDIRHQYLKSITS